MDLFLLKKIISALIMPLSLIIILLFLGILFYRKYPKFSFRCTCTATLLLFLSAFPPFSDWIMSPIEKQYPSFKNSSKTIDYIIILGCSHTNDKTLPTTSRLKACSLQRLVEAIRIYQLHPEAKIITSGGAFGQQTSNAQAVKQAAISLGIPENNIITENFPKDTQEEAELISPRVIGTNVVLVTNADHMPRAIKYFKQNGVNPIAAPAGHWVKNNTAHKNWRYYIPSSNKIEQSTTAWYEGIGLLWQWLNTFF